MPRKLTEERNNIIEEKIGISRRQFYSQIDIPPSIIAAFNRHTIMDRIELRRLSSVKQN